MRRRTGNIVAHTPTTIDDGIATTVTPHPSATMLLRPSPRENEIARCRGGEHADDADQSDEPEGLDGIDLSEHDILDRSRSAPDPDPNIVPRKMLPGVLTYATLW